MPVSTTFNPSPLPVRSGQGSAISNREDLEQGVYALEPEITPAYSLASKKKATATYHEWTLDKLDDPNTAGIPEGQDVTAFQNQFELLARTGNRTQIFLRTWAVTDEQNAVTSAVPVNVAQAKVKAMKNLKRDIEKTILGDQNLSVEDGGGTPNALRGLGNWLSTTGPADVPAAYRTPTESIVTSAPTETTFNDIIGSVFTKTGMTNTFTCIAGVALRKTIANFQRTDNNAGETVYHVNTNAEAKKVTLAVQIFDSDFGMVSLVNGNPDCMPNANRGYLIKPEYLAIATLIPTYNQDLENQGGGQRGYIKTDLTLVCGHPQAFGKIAY
jgi:Family of unknown function (DUF5309)